MSSGIVVLDTQLLVLLVVGSTSPSLILKHKKTKSYDIADFDLLSALIGQRPLLLLPNIVTEASNLLRWHQPPERDQISATLRRFVVTYREIYIESKAACSRPEYQRLGVANAALLLTKRDSVLLTADAALHVAAEASGLDTVNFNHERERYGLV